VSSIEVEKIGPDFILNPGTANAWEEGIYASERPLLSYLGSETASKEMKSCVIFQFPVDAACVFNHGSAARGGDSGTDRDLINANSAGRDVKFTGLIPKRLTVEELIDLKPVGLEDLPDDMPVYLMEYEYVQFM
jgi:hypothetical protein